jgi:hypothetical protein
VPTLLDLAETPDTTALDLDGHSLVDIIHGHRKAISEGWYLQEGWLYYLKEAAKPFIFERAVRTSAGTKYVVRGAMSEEELTFPSDDDAPNWMARTFGRCAIIYPSHHDIVHSALPAPAFSLIDRMSQPPRFALYDINTDPFEMFPLDVSMHPEVWRDFYEKYRWLMNHSMPTKANPELDTALHDTDTDAEEADLTEKLSAFGYL